MCSWAIVNTCGASGVETRFVFLATCATSEFLHSALENGVAWGWGGGGDGGMAHGLQQQLSTLRRSAMHTVLAHEPKAQRRN